MTPRRVGLLGGTFDPIHCGHIDAALAAEAALALTDVIVIPSCIPPHRPQPIASPYHRFAMAALAVAGRPHWRASDMELLASDRSYTSETLDALHAEGYTPTELFFIVGADAFTEIESWRNYPSIFDRAHFAVVARSGAPVANLGRTIPALASRMVAASTAGAASRTPSIFLIDAPTADVSSTAIRRRRGLNQSIAGLVPPAVEQHIEQHALYINAPDDERAAGARQHPAAGRLHGQD